MPAVDVRCPRTTLAPPAPLLAPCHAAALPTSCRGAHLAHSAPRAREERAQCGMLQHRPPHPTHPASPPGRARLQRSSGAAHPMLFGFGTHQKQVSVPVWVAACTREFWATFWSCDSMVYHHDGRLQEWKLRDWPKSPSFCTARQTRTDPDPHEAVGKKKTFFSRHGATAVRGWRRRRAAARLPLFPPPPRPLPSPRSRPGWRATGRVRAGAGAGAAAARRARVAALRERRRRRRGWGGAGPHAAQRTPRVFRVSIFRTAGGDACAVQGGAELRATPARARAGAGGGGGGGVGAREGEATKRRLGTKGLPRGRARTRLPRGRVRAHGQGSAPFEKRRAHRGSGGGRDARLQAGVGGA